MIFPGAADEKHREILFLREPSELILMQSSPVREVFKKPAVGQPRRRVP